MDAVSEDLLASPGRRVARLNSACVVCGQQNPHGLALSFHVDENGAHAQWTPSNEWESFQGVIHGGIVSTVLDEAMSKAIIACQWEAFTADLRVRFHSRVRPGELLQVRGWVVDRRKRVIRAEAFLASINGDERAHAWGTFLVPPPVSREEIIHTV